MPAVTSGGVPVRIGSRPPGIVGQARVRAVGDGVLAVGAQVVEAVGEPRADVPDDLARQLVAARRALGPQRRAALLREPVPGAGLQRRWGAGVVAAVCEEHRHARELSARHRDARVERQRAVEQHPARPAVRLGEHQGARDRHALAEAHEQDGTIGITLGVEPGEEPRCGRREALRVGAAVGLRVPVETGVARDRPADGDVGDGPVRQPGGDLDHGVFAGAVAVEGDDERCRRVPRAPAGDHRTVVRRHGWTVDRHVRRRCVRTRHAVCRDAGLAVSKSTTRPWRGKRYRSVTSP